MNHIKYWLGLLRWRRGRRANPQVASPRHATGGYVSPTPTGRRNTPPLEARVTEIEDLTRAVLYVTVATMLGVLVALGGVLSDQWRFNQDLYKEKTAEAATQTNDLTQQVKDLQLKTQTLTTQLNEAEAKQPK